VPFADLNNPQTLNLYAYVGNNPLSRADLDGHGWWEKLKNFFGDAGCWCEGQAAESAALRNLYAAQRRQQAEQRQAEEAQQAFRQAVKQHKVMIGVLAPIGPLGALGTEASSEAGTTVIGHYPEYVNLAEDLQANFFSVPTEQWNAMTQEEQWGMNQKFLDDAIARGDTFRVATPLDKVRPGSFLEKEINYLTSKGIKVEIGPQIGPIPPI
jgi:hypothetical protein